MFAPNLQRYGIYWSTRQNLDGYPVRPSLARIARIGRSLSITGAWFLTIVPCLALINPRAIGRRMLALVGAVIAVNWLFYCVVFFGLSRYRYLPDVFLCLPTAAVVGLIRHRGRPSLIVTQLDVPLGERRTT